MQHFQFLITLFLSKDAEITTIFNPTFFQVPTGTKQRWLLGVPGILYNHYDSESKSKNLLETYFHNIINVCSCSQKENTIFQ